jgi:hypothetical protein
MVHGSCAEYVDPVAQPAGSPCGHRPAWMPSVHGLPAACASAGTSVVDGLTTSVTQGDWGTVEYTVRRSQ